MSMNIVVTGAAGFLGSHLMLYHLRQGHAVIGIDDYSSSKRNSYQTSLYSSYNKARMVECDVSDRNFVKVIKFYQSKKIDLIYNFACPASPPRYQEIPIKTMMTCTVGTKNVLDLAEVDNAIVVHASTSEVYGDPYASPQKETYRGNVNSYGPRSCYDEGKRSAEALCYDYKNLRNVDARLVRIFNTYGPHMDSKDGRVVSNFINQALENKPLTIYGDGSQTRSFCYVDDLIRAIVAMGKLHKNPLSPINIGNPYEFTVKQLAELVMKKIPSPAGIKYESLPIDDPTQRRPDISLAKDILGWEPKINLEEGLDRTIEFFKNVNT